ncbi:MAG: DNA-binding transcriptional LysR family regulator [Verrucomicrobiales bacterium]|jgi:DNA-binding transcriptional LysR family regulator
MQLDVESLRTFISVLDLGGMTRAAESLDISQSAVSWKIKRLEEKVGRDLLIREGRTVRPSLDGRQLLGYARTIVATHDEAVARLESSELTGTVKLGTTEEISAARMCDVLARFNRIHPGATIEFVVDASTRLSEMLQRSELDVAVLQVLPDECRATDTLLWRDSLVWVSAPDWTYETGTVPLITFGDGGFYRPLAERALSNAGIPYTIAFSGPSAASVIGATEAGLGVAVLADSSVDGELIPWPRAVGLLTLPMSCHIARSSDGEPSRVAAELIADIVSELGESV